MTKAHFERFTTLRYGDAGEEKDDVYVNMDHVDLIRVSVDGGTTMCLTSSDEAFVHVMETIEELIARGLLPAKEEEA